MAWYPVQNLDFTVAAAYQDAKYDDYPGAACLATQPITQCNSAIPASIAANNIKGAPLPYTSKVSYSIQGHHRLELANDTAIDTTIGVHGRSKYFDSDNQSPLFGRQKAYTKLDARIQYGPTDERWDLAFIAQYPDAGAFFAMVTDPDYREWVKHRTAAVEDSRLIRLSPLTPGEGFGE